MALETEYETYQRHLPEWRDKEGQFVVIHGEDVVEFFESYRDALRYGYRTFGLEPFLVKRVQVIGPVQFISRLVDPLSRVCVS